MRDQLKKFFKLYSVFILLSIISYSCCDDTIQITGKGSFKAYEIPGNETYTIANEFELVALFATNFSIVNSFKLNLTQSLYATSCDAENLNYIVPDSLIISTNKDFVFDGQTINANANLLDVSELNEKLSLGYETVSLLFTNDVLDKISFDNEEYIFKIYAETTDGLQLENELTITFNF